MTDHTFTPARLPLWRRIVRRVGKGLLAWRYRRFTPESSPDSIVNLAGLRLLVKRGVFNPSMHFTSGVLARYIRTAGVVPRGGSVLDLGTGTGVLALSARLAGAGRVVACDINPAAVECARVNVQSLGLADLVSVRQGDMFAPVQGERFDLVLCNPPYFRGEPRSMAERAYLAGPGLEWLRRFANSLGEHLEPRGSAIISIGDAADLSAITALLSECGWTCTVVARRDILVETIYLFRLTRTTGETPHA
jgi:release factor glutamine methyltransferase